MYNDMMYNMPFRGVMPCCPFMHPMYGIPNDAYNMMRSEDMELQEDIPFDDNLDDSVDNNLDSGVDEDLRDTTEENIQDEAAENIEENIEDTRDEVEDSPAEIEYDENQFRSPADVNSILRKIEKNNPMLIRRLVMYGVPYPVAVRMVRRIIYLTLEYE